MYKEKRPDKILAEGSLFYIGINKKSKGDAWYVSQPLELGNIVKSMCEEAGIQGRKVNHSARKNSYHNTCTCRGPSDTSSAAFRP